MMIKHGCLLLLLLLCGCRSGSRVMFEAKGYGAEAKVSIHTGESRR